MSWEKFSDLFALALGRRKTEIENLKYFFGKENSRL